jgi:hypothetical protein
MTDTTLVPAKLTTLGEHVDRMERRRSSTMEAFLADVDRQDALALSLMVALQEAADIALHIAADEGGGLRARFTTEPLCLCVSVAEILCDLLPAPRSPLCARSAGRARRSRQRGRQSAGSWPGLQG